jgi:hypothetical protein
MEGLTIDIPNKDLFAVHAELNQITGIVLAVLYARGLRSTPITEMFPQFVKIVDAVNDEMQQYAIT